MIPEELKEELREINTIITSIVTDARLFEALQQALEEREYNGAQLQDIHDNATETLFQAVDGGSLAHSLAKGFTDPMMKATQNIGTGISVIDFMHKPASRGLYNGGKLLGDIIYNYPMLLGDDMPEIVKETLDTYKNLIPRLQKAYEKLNTDQENPYNPDLGLPYYNGCDHLNRLDEDFETLELKPPEPSGP